MKLRNPVPILTALALGLALSGGGQAAEPSEAGRDRGSGRLIAGTIELHRDGRVVRVPRPAGPAARHGEAPSPRPASAAGAEGGPAPAHPAHSGRVQVP